MLKAKTIAKVLEQANTEGVQQSMYGSGPADLLSLAFPTQSSRGFRQSLATRRLLSPEGSLVAYAGPSERNARLFAALAANIWTTYDKDVKDALDATEPETITIDYQVRDRMPVAGTETRLPTRCTRPWGRSGR